MGREREHLSSFPSSPMLTSCGPAIWENARRDGFDIVGVGILRGDEGRGIFFLSSFNFLSSLRACLPEISKQYSEAKLSRFWRVRSQSFLSTDSLKSLERRAGVTRCLRV